MPDNPAPRDVRYPRWLLALLAIAIVVAAATGPILRWSLPPRGGPEPVHGANAVGDATCLSCHAKKASYESTAHRLTSRLPTAESVKGNFHPGANVLHTTNPYVHFRMDATPAGFYETAVTGTGADTTSRTERIAYVIGSGRKGQTYIFRDGDAFFELPVSWWRSPDTWINSPGAGYVDGQVRFDRPIAPRCLDCHATWLQSLPSLQRANRYDTTQVMLGVTCERCHGAGQEHVARERSPFRAVRAVAIVNPARLDRQRQIDACAQCHGGLGEPIAPSFSYVPGRPLQAYMDLPVPSSGDAVDVHGNQVALLARSKCFQSSQMTCLTCHDVHQTQRDVAQLSNKCLTCHQLQSCGLFPKEGHALAGRCVDCHMPLQQSTQIVSMLGDTAQRVLVRSHWIKVYEQRVQSGRQ